MYVANGKFTWTLFSAVMILQWNLRIKDTLGSISCCREVVLFSEVKNVLEV